MRPRHRVDELMDDPALDRGEHARALVGLARLNRWSRSHRILWPGIAREARLANAAGRALRVLDVAAGSGDAVVAMASLARRAGLEVEWGVADVSAFALESARDRAEAAGVALATSECDLFAGRLDARADVVVSSLFLHHCDDAQAVAALGAMRGAAEVAVGVSDLDRTRAGLALAWLGSRVLSRSRVVRFDALASVRGAYAPDEARALARRAGLDDAVVERTWPERWRLWWRRPS
jgi:2-polyprenyl-3-methyl-5-hydroxy-6-metoxy-1,4-benzoquinol methylase